MFTYMPKVHFITHFFLEILHIKKPYKLTGWLQFDLYLKTQNFAGIGGDISIKILVFILDYFKKKLRTKLFKKSRKTYFGAIFQEKRPLSFLKYSNCLRSCKNLKKQWTIPEKNAEPTDGRKDRQTTVIL